MRLALAARPRLRREFQSGDCVCYWRKELGSREAEKHRGIERSMLAGMVEQL